MLAIGGGVVGTGFLFSVDDLGGYFLADVGRQLAGIMLSAKAQSGVYTFGLRAARALALSSWRCSAVRLAMRDLPAAD